MSVSDEEIQAALVLIWEENRPPVMWQVVENSTAYEMARTLLDALAEVATQPVSVCHDEAPP